MELTGNQKAQRNADCISEIVKGGRTDELVTKTCKKYGVEEAYIRKITDWREKRTKPKFRNPRRVKAFFQCKTKPGMNGRCRRQCNECKEYFKPLE
jgi:hypothetical protein